MDVDRALLHVELKGIPVPIWARTKQWFDGLIREFDIVATDTDDEAPKRLLAFVHRVTADFDQFRDQTSEPLQSAHQSGIESLHLEVRLPETAGPAALSLLRHIEEAEEYCRDGDMLTLTSSSEVRRFYTWYLREIARQIDGADPVPWSEVE